MVRVAILVIGNEILSGETIDTNSAFAGQKLADAGFKVSFKLTVGDIQQDILNGIKACLEVCDVVITSGGLGPTNDDITRNALCKYFNRKLVFNDEVFDHIKEILKHRIKSINTINKDQALIPENSIIFWNNLGTAVGLGFEQGEKFLVALPGVPFEMKELVEFQVIPFLVKKFGESEIINRNIKTVGIPESIIAERIADIENNLPENVSLAYLPSIGQVKLRLTGNKDLKDEIERISDEITSVLLNYIYGYGEETLPQSILKMLLSDKKSVSIAESCTGGYISHQLTSVPGSSACFTGSVVAYSNEIKRAQLNVDQEILEKYGAVSKETAIAMCEGIRKKFCTDYSVAVTGIAGPDGGTPEKPVGTVWIAASDGNTTSTLNYIYDRGRIQNIQFAAVSALNLLRKLLSGIG